MNKELQRMCTQPLYSLPLPYLVHCLSLNSVKPNWTVKKWTPKRTQGKPKSSLTKTKLAVKKTSLPWNFFVMKTKTYVRCHSPHFLPFRLSQLPESRSGCPCIAQITSSEELGTMSQNNLRGITLVREPMWRIHFLHWQSLDWTEYLLSPD